MFTPEERAAINRANAAKSTGPKTLEGKKRSSLNATRHGLTGQVIIKTAEDLAAYTAFEDSFHDHYQPTGPVENQCVQFMIDASWKLNRSTAWQDQILAERSYTREEKYSPENNPQVNAALASASVVAEITHDLANLSIYEQRLHNMFERSLRRLEALQAQRKANHRRELEEAALLLRLHEHEESLRQEAHAKAYPEAAPLIPAPYTPSTDGFIHTIVEIKAHIDRAQRLREAKLLPLTRKAAA